MTIVYENNNGIPHEINMFGNSEFNEENKLRHYNIETSLLKWMSREELSGQETFELEYEWY